MITLINPPGLKTFSGLQMHTPNPPLGLAYIAAAVREAGFAYQVIDAAGEALDDENSQAAQAASSGNIRWKLIRLLGKRSMGRAPA